MASKKGMTKLQEFSYNLNLVYEAIQNKKFSHAVVLFSRIEVEFDENSPDINDKIKKEITELKNELCLYMRINEAYIFAELGNLSCLRAELDYIYSQLYGLEYDTNLKPLVDYIKGNYKFCLEYYTFKITKRHFIDDHQSASELIKNGKHDKALKKFSQLIIVYNKLQNYCSDDEKERYYSQLKYLFKEISTAHVIGLHSKSEIIESATSSIVKEKREDEITFNNKYNDIRNLLDKGDIEKASELLKKI